MNFPKLEQLKEKFHQKYIKTSEGCWESTSYRMPNGYTQFSIGHQQQMYAHRFAYAAYNGDIPADTLVLHRCDNRCCVNPEHLFLGSHRDNMLDMYSKDRQFKGSRSVGVTNPKAKLTDDDIIKIRASSATKKQLAAEFGVSNVMISYILNRKNWTHV